MKTIIYLVAITGLSLIFSGCETSTSGNPAVQSRLQTPEQLIDGIRKAHGTQEISELEKLSHLEGVDDLTREGITESFREMLDRKLSEINIEALDPTLKLEYEISGKTYRPNLEPEGRMKINYLQTDGRQDHLNSTTFLFGRINGEYRLGFSAPVN